MSEDTRAAEYRRQVRVRARNKLAAERALAGNPVRRRALDVKVEPLLTVDSNGVRRGDVHR